MDTSLQGLQALLQQIAPISEALQHQNEEPDSNQSNATDINAAQTAMSRLQQLETQLSWLQQLSQKFDLNLDTNEENTSDRLNDINQDTLAVSQSSADIIQNPGELTRGFEPNRAPQSLTTDQSAAAGTTTTMLSELQEKFAELSSLQQKLSQMEQYNANLASMTRLAADTVQNQVLNQRSEAHLPENLSNAEAIPQADSFKQMEDITSEHSDNTSNAGNELLTSVQSASLNLPSQHVNETSAEGVENAPNDETIQDLYKELQELQQQKQGLEQILNLLSASSANTETPIEQGIEHNQINDTTTDGEDSNGIDQGILQSLSSIWGNRIQSGLAATQPSSQMQDIYDSLLKSEATTHSQRESDAMHGAKIPPGHREEIDQSSKNYSTATEGGSFKEKEVNVDSDTEYSDDFESVASEHNKLNQMSTDGPQGNVLTDIEPSQQHLREEVDANSATELKRLQQRLSNLTNLFAEITQEGLSEINNEETASDTNNTSFAEYLTQRMSNHVTDNNDASTMNNVKTIHGSFGSPRPTTSRKVPCPSPEDFTDYIAGFRPTSGEVRPQNRLSHHPATVTKQPREKRPTSQQKQRLILDSDAALHERERELQEEQQLLHPSSEKLSAVAAVQGAQDQFSRSQPVQVLDIQDNKEKIDTVWSNTSFATASFATSSVSTSTDINNDNLSILEHQSVECTSFDRKSSVDESITFELSPEPRERETNVTSVVDKDNSALNDIVSSLQFYDKQDDESDTSSYFEVSASELSQNLRFLATKLATQSSNDDYVAQSVRAFITSAHNTGRLSASDNSTSKSSNSSTNIPSNVVDEVETSDTIHQNSQNIARPPPRPNGTPSEWLISSEKPTRGRFHTKTGTSSTSSNASDVTPAVTTGTDRVWRAFQRVLRRASSNAPDGNQGGADILTGLLLEILRDLSRLPRDLLGRPEFAKSVAMQAKTAIKHTAMRMKSMKQYNQSTGASEGVKRTLSRASVSEPPRAKSARVKHHSKKPHENQSRNLVTSQSHETPIASTTVESHVSRTVQPNQEPHHSIGHSSHVPTTKRHNKVVRVDMHGKRLSSRSKNTKKKHATQSMADMSDTSFHTDTSAEDYHARIVPAELISQMTQQLHATTKPLNSSSKPPPTVDQSFNVSDPSRSVQNILNAVENTRQNLSQLHLLPTLHGTEHASGPFDYAESVETDNAPADSDASSRWSYSHPSSPARSSMQSNEQNVQSVKSPQRTQRNTFVNIREFDNVWDDSTVTSNSNTHDLLHRMSTTVHSNSQPIQDKTRADSHKTRANSHTVSYANAKSSHSRNVDICSTAKTAFDKDKNHSNALCDYVESVSTSSTFPHEINTPTEENESIWSENLPTNDLVSQLSPEKMETTLTEMQRYIQQLRTLWNEVGSNSVEPDDSTIATLANAKQLAAAATQVAAIKASTAQARVDKAKDVAATNVTISKARASRDAAAVNVTVTKARAPRTGITKAPVSQGTTNLRSSHDDDDDASWSFVSGGNWPGTSSVGTESSTQRTGNNSPLNANSISSVNMNSAKFSGKKEMIHAWNSYMASVPLPEENNDVASWSAHSESDGGASIRSAAASSISSRSRAQASSENSTVRSTNGINRQYDPNRYRIPTVQEISSLRNLWKTSNISD